MNYEPAQRGSPTRFSMDVRMPKELPDDQRERLMQIAAKCPVHRTLEGEVMFDERVTLRARRFRACALRRSHISMVPKRAVAEPLVDRPPELRGLEGAHLAAARPAVRQSAAHEARAPGRARVPPAPWPPTRCCSRRGGPG